MEENGKLGGLVLLTDEQFIRLEALPVSGVGISIVFANKSGIYSKEVYSEFTVINFTKLNEKRMITGCLTFNYSTANRKCKFVYGDISELDQFLSEAIEG